MNYYNDFGSWIRTQFPFRVQKISIDAGFSCPNRDGRISSGGCTYCDNRTFNPSYCNRKKTITEQLEEGKRFFGRKYPDMKYLAYFQAYTNTYASLEDLRRMYEEALRVEDIVGIVIGTRPDCVSEELLDYLAELNKRTFVLVEYGIETANDETLSRINRGHDFACSRKAVEQTHVRGILTGGHIIILNPVGSEFYNADLEQAYSALSAFEGGLQIGGGINDENAAQFLEKGASHVIVTSFVFKNGVVNFYNLNRLVKSVGKSRLVLDLSCRKRDGKYYVVTDRWQKFTDIEMNSQTLEMFSKYCDEFLIHAVDTEGKAKGIEPQIAKIMGEYCTIPSTYAGGISSFEDLDNLKELGRGKIDFTIGSALDIFGGNMNFEKVAVYGK